ncbi:helix-turn-helix domain-containing protein [Reyranella sp.]|uniref:helix-turn-helix domain-containing protein n=1 Tax=Reyranella sp. TaxID=1929291 RepID=UPI003783FFB9
MYSHPQHRASYDVKQLRQDAGRWLKQLREARGLSQRELAKLVGLNFYTFVSQLESGRGRIPPDRYRVWADALGVDPQDFVKELLRYYDPITHYFLFEAGGEGHEMPRATPDSTRRLM